MNGNKSDPNLSIYDEKSGKKVRKTCALIVQSYNLEVT